VSAAAEGAEPVAPQAPAAAPASLVVDNVVIERGGREVVRGVSLEVPAGEVTALLGPNGAGKSTLVLAIGGVLRPLSGSISVAGKNLVGRRPERIRRDGVAIVPEGRRLLGDLTVEDNLRVATYSLPNEQAQQAHDKALEMFPELKPRLGAPGRALSGGEQQMLVLAQALVTEPSFIVIDELSLGLAPIIVSRLIPTIRELAQDGIGVLLIEQFSAVALTLAQGAYIMESGALHYTGTAQELKDNPELLSNAYLLRGVANAAAASAVATPEAQS
jgi:branched-chain amino acid transport system ATP-binding protein